MAASRRTARHTPPPAPERSRIPAAIARGHVPVRVTAPAFPAALERAQELLKESGATLDRIRSSHARLIGPDEPRAADERGPTSDTWVYALAGTLAQIHDNLGAIEAEVIRLEQSQG